MFPEAWGPSLPFLGFILFGIGSLFTLMIIPPDASGKGFHSFIIFLLLVVYGPTFLLLLHESAELLRAIKVVHGLLVLTFLGWFALNERVRGNTSRWMLAPSWTLSGVHLYLLARWTAHTYHRPLALTLTFLLLCSLMLGSVTVGMILGHWYLVRRSLPIRLLVKASRFYFIVTLARLTSFFIRMFQVNIPMTSFHLETVFALQRVLFGIILPPVFAWMVLQSARSRSTQSATGIFYAALVMTWMGEWLGLYLMLYKGVFL